MKISVLTPSIRIPGLKIVADALEQQSFKDFEWLIGSPFNPKIKEAIWVKDDFKGGFWSLNRIYNALFKKSKGELLVSWQDWVYANPDVLEKFWTNYKQTGGIISAVGDQYLELDKWGKPFLKIWTDPRKRLDQGSFYEINHEDVEWNLACFSRSDILEVGGMCELLDFEGYGGDQYQVGERWDFLGKKFYIDQSLESFTLRHDRSDFGGQEKWDKHHVLFSGAYQKIRKKLIKEGKWPHLSYLQK